MVSFFTIVISISKLFRHQQSIASDKAAVNFTWIRFDSNTFANVYDIYISTYTLDITFLSFDRKIRPGTMLHRKRATWDHRALAKVHGLLAPFTGKINNHRQNSRENGRVNAVNNPDFTKARTNRGERVHERIEMNQRHLAASRRVSARERGVESSAATRGEFRLASMQSVLLLLRDPKNMLKHGNYRDSLSSAIFIFCIELMKARSITLT